MFSALAKLGLQVDSTDVENATDELKKLAKQGKKTEQSTEKSTDRLSASWKVAGAAAAGLGVAVAAIGARSIKSQRQFDQAFNQLFNVTGSIENASTAVDILRETFDGTSVTINEAASSFARLSSLGLEASEETLTAFANIAAAQPGKTINDVVEAAADAAVGEFERLKEFGIKARNEGDTIAFTFAGVTTSVANNSEEIQRYLSELGNTEFGGFLNNGLDTLDKSFAQASKTIDEFFLNISQQSGLDVSAISILNAFTDALRDVNTVLASGEIAARIDAVQSLFGGFGADISRTADALSGFSIGFGETGETIGNVVGFITEQIALLPATIRAKVQRLVVDLASDFDRLTSTAQFFADSISAVFDDTTVSDARAAFEERTRVIDAAQKSSISAINAERDAVRDSFSQQIADAKNLTEEFKRQKEERETTLSDLVENKSAGDKGEKQKEVKQRVIEETKEVDTSAIDNLRKSLASEKDLIEQNYKERQAIVLQFTAKESAEQKDLLARLRAERKDALNKEFDQLANSLRTEEENILDSYNKRREIILDNTEATEQEKNNLLQRLNEDFKADALNGLGGVNSTDDEIALLEEKFAKRRELILSNEALTEAMRTELLTEAERNRTEQIASLESARMSLILASSTELFGGLSNLAKQFAGEQSDTYRALFAIEQGFAIAKSVVNIQSALAQAINAPFPQNLGNYATVATQASGIISTIRGVKFAGAYDNGGFIPPGQVGLVGEVGPELVKGPANVTGRRETARKIEEASSGMQSIKIVNTFDRGEVVGGYLNTNEGERLIMNVVKKNPGTIKALAAR